MCGCSIVQTDAENILATLSIRQANANVSILVQVLSSHNRPVLYDVGMPSDRMFTVAAALRQGQAVALAERRLGAVHTAIVVPVRWAYIQ